MWSVDLQLVVLPPFRGRNWRGAISIGRFTFATVSGDTAEEVNAALTRALGEWLAKNAAQQDAVQRAPADFSLQELGALANATDAREALAPRWQWLRDVLALSLDELVQLARLPPDARIIAIQMHKVHAFGSHATSEVP